MNADDILLEMKLIAEEQGYELTENAEKIAGFRARANIPLSVCPCCRGDKTRYCISEQCKKDIEMFSTCHCRAYRTCK